MTENPLIQRCPYCRGTGKVQFRSMATGEWEDDVCLNCDGPPKSEEDMRKAEARYQLSFDNISDEVRAIALKALRR